MKLNSKQMFLVGRLAGIILGISVRGDIPPEVKEVCKKAHDKYNALFNDHPPGGLDEEDYLSGMV